MGASTKAVVEVLDDGPRVRIVRYTLPPGGSTGWHRHELDYIIVPYQDCRVQVVTPSGRVEAEMLRDKPYYREKGVEHDVTSLSDKPFSFLEIEIR
ncbi:MAG: cupin [Hyphomicrobiaceae bacterium]|nr:cupin [Hyphomicrobiaceae bacterium]